MNLKGYYFPVEERDVYFTSQNKFYDWTANSYIYKPTEKAARQYKAIVRQDNNSLISIVNKNYKLVPNAELIEQVMQQLELFSGNWTETGTWIKSFATMKLCRTIPIIQAADMMYPMQFC